MKKKESFWKLIKRLDEQAGDFNATLHEANRYFDTAAQKTKSIIARHEKDLQSAISKVKKVLKKFAKREKSKKDKKGEG